MILAAHYIDDLPSIARQIVSFAGQNRIFLFYGDMGAGKTTLIKAICKHLGAEDAVTSPSFAIVNEYQTPSTSIYHFDFYRLKDQREAFDLGYEEYFYSGAYCFIEWPEKIPDLLPESFIKTEITVTADGSRNLVLNKI